MSARTAPGSCNSGEEQFASLASDAGNIILTSHRRQHRHRIRGDLKQPNYETAGIWGNPKQHMKLQQPRIYDFGMFQFNLLGSQGGNSREMTSPPSHHWEATVALTTAAKLQQFQANSREMTSQKLNNRCHRSLRFCVASCLLSFQVPLGILWGILFREYTCEPVRPVQGQKPQNREKRVWSQKTPFPPPQEKGISSQNPQFHTGHNMENGDFLTRDAFSGVGEMGFFWLRNPLFPILGFWLRYFRNPLRPWPPNRKFQKL